MKDVSVDGFWSISLCNAKDNFAKNAQNVYSVNNITSKKDADGSVQFGGRKAAFLKPSPLALLFE